MRFLRRRASHLNLNCGRLVEWPLRKAQLRASIYGRKHWYETDLTHPRNRPYTFQQYGQPACRRLRRRLRVLAFCAAIRSRSRHRQCGLGSFLSDLRLCAAALPLLLSLQLPSVTRSLQPAACPGAIQLYSSGDVFLRAGFILGPELTWRRALGSRSDSLRLRARRSDQIGRDQRPASHAAADR